MQLTTLALQESGVELHCCNRLPAIRGETTIYHSRHDRPASQTRTQYRHHVNSTTAWQRRSEAQFHRPRTSTHLTIHRQHHPPCPTTPFLSLSFPVSVSVSRCPHVNSPQLFTVDTGIANRLPTPATSLARNRTDPRRSAKTPAASSPLTMSYSTLQTFPPRNAGLCRVRGLHITLARRPAGIR